MNEIQRLAEVFQVGCRQLLDEIVAWRAETRDRGQLTAGTTPGSASRLAADFNHLYDVSAGILTPNVLTSYIARYERRTPDAKYHFRARVIGHKARHLADVTHSPLSYAGRLGDGWFPRPH